MRSGSDSVGRKEGFWGAPKHILWEFMKSVSLVPWTKAMVVGCAYNDSAFVKSQIAGFGKTYEMLWMNESINVYGIRRK